MNLRIGLGTLLVVAALVTGCGRGGGGHVKGVAPKGEPRAILSVHSGDAPTLVTVRGKMIEKCPTAGCWFRIHDDTGVVKVDTKSAGFVVTELPLGTELTVAGKIGHDGDETIIEATGLRY